LNRLQVIGCETLCREDGRLGFGPATSNKHPSQLAMIVNFVRNIDEQRPIFQLGPHLDGLQIPC
jgi:hypothetical protein